MSKQPATNQNGGDQPKPSVSMLLSDEVLNVLTANGETPNGESAKKELPDIGVQNAEASKGETLIIEIIKDEGQALKDELSEGELPKDEHSKGVGVAPLGKVPRDEGPKDGSSKTEATKADTPIVEILLGENSQGEVQNNGGPNGEKPNEEKPQDEVPKGEAPIDEAPCCDILKDNELKDEGLDHISFEGVNGELPKGEGPNTEASTDEISNNKNPEGKAAIQEVLGGKASEAKEPGTDEDLNADNPTGEFLNGDASQTGDLKAEIASGEAIDTGALNLEGSDAGAVGTAALYSEALGAQGLSTLSLSGELGSPQAEVGQQQQGVPQQHPSLVGLVPPNFPRPPSMEYYDLGPLPRTGPYAWPPINCSQAALTARDAETLEQLRVLNEALRIQMCLAGLNRRQGQVGAQGQTQMNHAPGMGPTTATSVQVPPVEYSQERKKQELVFKSWILEFMVKTLLDLHGRYLEQGYQVNLLTANGNTSENLVATLNNTIAHMNGAKRSLRVEHEALTKMLFTEPLLPLSTEIQRVLEVWNNIKLIIDMYADI